VASWVTPEIAAALLGLRWRLALLERVGERYGEDVEIWPEEHDRSEGRRT